MLPAAKTNLQPASAKIRAATIPNAPDAPVISAVLPSTSNICIDFIISLQVDKALQLTSYTHGCFGFRSCVSHQLGLYSYHILRVPFQRPQ